MDVDLAAAFEQETGCVGEAPQVVFRVKSYGDVQLVVWRADEKKLDEVLRRISSG